MSPGCSASRRRGGTRRRRARPACPPSRLEFDDDPAGRSIRASILQNGATSVAKGGTVDLVGLQGRALVAGARRGGETWRQAKQILADQGFKVKFKNPISEFLSSVPDNSTVKSIDPRPGSTVDKGSTVTIALQAG